MDYRRLASELVRQLRGKRSQLALSRHLGYRSNVVRTWEAGRRFCKVSVFFRLCERSGVGREVVLDALYRDVPEPLLAEPWTSPTFAGHLLDDLRGSNSILTVAQKAQVNRYTTSRWLSGTAEPSLPEFLLMLDAVSLRMLDFISAIVDPAKVPAVAHAWRQMEAARSVARRFPWSHAVLRVLELNEYRELQEHRPGFIARRLGIAMEQEVECLLLLAESGQIVKEGTRWVAGELQHIDMRSSTQDTSALRLWWAQTGVDHIRQGKRGQFSYNLFTVSTDDFARLKSLHLSYFRQVRSIISQSTSADHVVVANVQLFELGDET